MAPSPSAGSHWWNERYIEKASGKTPKAKKRTKNGAMKRYGASWRRRHARSVGGALAADTLVDEGFRIRQCRLDVLALRDHLVELGIHDRSRHRIVAIGGHHRDLRGDLAPEHARRLPAEELDRLLEDRIGERGEERG